jgi:hypothetical protein
MTDRKRHVIILRRLYRDPRGAELLLSYHAQMAALAAHAFARGRGFARLTLGDAP